MEWAKDWSGSEEKIEMIYCRKADEHAVEKNKMYGIGELGRVVSMDTEQKGEVHEGRKARKTRC